MILKTLATGTKTLLLVLVVLAAAYAGWRWGDAVFTGVEATTGGRATAGGRGVADDTASDSVSPETAEAAAARIQAFRASDDPELRLASFELSSLLRYTVPGMLPAGVIHPRVSMADDRIDIEVAVLPAAMPELPDLGAITGMLPDTVPVSVSGSLAPFEEDGSMLLIRGIRVQGVPIPPPAFPEILAAMGRRDADGLPASAVLVPAFRAIKGAYIENGELVLVRA